MSETYTITVTVPDDPQQAEARVREALAEQGFGVLSEIDVEAALRTKLGEEIGAYKILGACNPPLAKRAIEADPDIGALLPCNVLVRANPDGGTDVAAADPAAMLSLAADGVDEVAAEARERIVKALDALR
jgi:uncharacterized protein (DUF302 family)